MSEFVEENCWSEWPASKKQVSELRKRLKELSFKPVEKEPGTNRPIAKYLAGIE